MIVPSPAPDEPWSTVRNAALLTAPQLQVDVLLTEMDAEPPVAGNDVVVLPVITWHPLGAVVEEHPEAPTANAAIAKKQFAIHASAQPAPDSTMYSRPIRLRLIHRFQQLSLRQTGQDELRLGDR
jgi:hypothetical protein